MALIKNKTKPFQIVQKELKMEDKMQNNNGGPSSPTSPSMAQAPTPRPHLGTGGTGGPGASNTVDPSEQFLDNIQNEDAMALYVGATAGPGMPGSVEEAREQDLEFNDVRQRFRDKVRNKNTEEQGQIMAETWKKMLPKVIQHRKEEAAIAILLGDMGNVIKATVPHGEWLPTARRHFPEVEIRALQDYMRIAGIRKVENHTSLGIFRLIKLAPLASSESFTAEDDPIQAILNAASSKLETTTEEPNTLAAIAIASSRLSKAGLTIEIAVLRDFVKAGYQLTAKDIKEMLAMVENGQDPTDFLREVIKNAGARVFPLTNPGSGEKMEKEDKAPSVPNIDTAFQQASDTISLALTQSTISASDITRARYERLMKDLKAFGEKAFGAEVASA